MLTGQLDFSHFCQEDQDHCCILCGQSRDMKGCFADWTMLTVLCNSRDCGAAQRIQRYMSVCVNHALCLSLLYSLIFMLQFSIPTNVINPLDIRGRRVDALRSGGYAKVVK